MAIASRDEQKARKVSAKLGIPRHYNDYMRLLESSDVDIVYIPLPNSLHHEWTILAAEHGKHVLCEKPLALNTRECEEMVSACQKSGVWLLEGYMYRHFQHVIKLKEMIKKGVIGNVSVVRSEFTFPLTDSQDIRLQKQLGGGALYDVGCYCVDFSRLLTNSKWIKVKAFAHYHQRGVDNTLTGLILFENNQIGAFDCGFQTNLRHSVEIIGEKGTLTIPAAFEPEFKPTQIILKRGEKSQKFQFEPCNPYRLMVQHFVNCILQKESPSYTSNDSIENMRLIDALYESARMA